MTRTPLVVGNWKMELSHKAAVALAKALVKSLMKEKLETQIVVCPSFPSLMSIKEQVSESAIEVGAQDVFTEEKGAHTGQVSITQLADFATWCIVGHSETRAASHVTDDQVAIKTELLLKHGLTPIVCIGETLEERQGDETARRVTRQVESLLRVLPRVALLKTVIVYEPIWAIGTGFTPQPDEVAEIILLIRKMVAGRFDGQAAERLRILYGGSVKPDNVVSYVGGPYADGVLVGGASVHTGQFVDIIHSVEKAIL
jgi:triosephosphate isomerase (TIM)